MSTPYRKKWNPEPRKRIDARPPSPEKAAGMKWLHYGTDGRVIGGVTKEGIPFGTRARQGAKDGSSLGNPTTPGLDQRMAMNPQGSPSSPMVGPPVPVTLPATGQRLADRQSLYAEMVRAGRSGITPEMHARATALGVKGPSWLRTSLGIQKAPGMIANDTVPTPGGTASSAIVGPFKQGQDSPNLTPQIASNTPGAVPAVAAGGVRINRLTGKPFGYRPGDAPAPSPSSLQQTPLVPWTHAAPKEPAPPGSGGNPPSVALNTGGQPSWKAATMSPINPNSPTPQPVAAPPQPQDSEEERARKAREAAARTQPSAGIS